MRRSVTLILLMYLRLDPFRVSRIPPIPALSDKFSIPSARTYYEFSFINLATSDPSNPTTFLGTTVTRPSNLNFYPYLNANNSIIVDTDVTSAIACIKSTTSGTRDHGSVDGFVVQCDDFYTARTFQKHFSTCQTALHTVRQRIGPAANLLVALPLSAVPEDDTQPASIQGLYATSAIYNTSVNGAVVQLYVDENGNHCS